MIDDSSDPALALIAHDGKKADLVAFVNEHVDLLLECDLVATGTTGSRLNEETSLSVERVASGPLGGDLEIGAAVSRGVLDGVIFLRDPLTAQPHEPDIGALLRICDVTDTALATNLGSAEGVLRSLFESDENDENDESDESNESNKSDESDRE